MNEKLIDEYLEHAMKDVPPESRDEIKRDQKLRIMEKAIKVASEKNSPVNDDIVGGVLKAWPPYTPIHPTPTPTPEKKTGLADRWKSWLSLAGLAIVFIVVDVLFMVLVPDASGVPNPTASSIVNAVIISLVVVVAFIGIITALMYLYETRIKKNRGGPLDPAEKIIKDTKSPVRVGILIVTTAIWMALLYRWWRDIPVPSFDQSNTMTYLFSDQFASFVPIILVLGVAMIAVNILYLVIPAKWIVSLAETVLNACVALMFYLMIQDFPFGSDLSQTVKTGIYVILVLFFLLMALGVAKNLMLTMRLIGYSDEGVIKQRRTPP